MTTTRATIKELANDRDRAIDLVATFTDQLREAVLEAGAEGIPITTLAELAGVTRATIYDWMKNAD